tara:strand:- start:246 stop:416 length:171 start_codon:yes stop_codon:yes gene_type:complete
MTPNRDIELLQQRHHHLEDQIRNEATRPARDDLKINALKKEKLRIKDQMQQLQSAN